MVPQDLSLLSKRELNDLFPEADRWESDQLRRITKDELLASVHEYLGRKETQVSAAVQATATPTKNGITRLPMRRLTVKNSDRIISAARAFFETMNIDPNDWDFVSNKYDDDRGTRLEINHSQLGLVSIFETYRGYVFDRPE